VTDLTCKKCGWVHFGISREYAESEIKSFNQYFDSLSKEKQEQCYGGRKNSIEQYEHCFFCGNTYQDFRPAVKGDCPDGVTMQPIINYYGS